MVDKIAVKPILFGFKISLKWSHLTSDLNTCCGMFAKEEYLTFHLAKWVIYIKKKRSLTKDVTENKEEKQVI